MSVVNSYSAEPAFPILAHSLLPQCTLNTGNERNEAESAPTLPVDQTGRESWDLGHDIERGLRGSPDTVLRFGTVIGFSRLRKWSTVDDDEYIGQLPRYILAKHLRSNSPQSTSTPNTFIIHPANYDAFSPKKLLASLLFPTHQLVLSRDEAINHLDSVQLFPVFDFGGAVQAVSQISDTLHKTRQQQEQQQQSRFPDQTNQATSQATERHAVVLIIAGLDTLAESVIRGSNRIKGTALLTATLRSLTLMSRTFATSLSVVLVNTSGIGSFTQASHRDATSGSSAAGTGHPTSQVDQTLQMRDDGVHSMFRVTGGSLFPSLLLRTLDQGIDTHVLISTVKTAQVAEVIKDRVGDGVGKWCIWKNG